MFTTLKRAAFTGAVLALSFATASYAAVFAGGPIAGGTSQGAAACYVTNTGATAVSFSNYSIVGQFGAHQTLTYNTCGSSLAAYSTCGLAANVMNNQAYACEFTTVGTTAALRGTADVREANGSVILISTPMR